MVDKGEKHPFGERKNGLGGFLKGKGTFILTLVLIVMVALQFVQSNQLIEKINKYLNEADVSVHDIYDDTKVIEAYKKQDPTGLDAKETFLYNKISEVFNEVITDDMSDYEKELAIYNWQFNWTHDNTQSMNPIGGASDNYTPYGVLTGHDTICVGNATTFKLFMDALGIPCKIIHSTSNGEHAWDVVQIEGDWYHVDLTFDTGSINNPAYSYFNVPDSIKDDGSYPWDHNEIPACNGYKYCYLYNNAEELDDIYAIPKYVKNCIDENVGGIFFTLKNPEGFSSAVMEYIIGCMNTSDNSYLYYQDTKSIGGKTIYALCYSKYGDSDTVPQEVLDKLIPIIDELNYGEGYNYDGNSYDYNGNNGDAYEAVG